MAGLAGGYGGWTIERLREEPKIAKAQIAQAQAQRDLSDVNALVARAEAGQERTRAQEAQKLAADQASLQKQLDDARTKFAVAEKARKENSDALLHALSLAPPAEAGKLSPSVLRYIDRVRQQSTPQAGSNPTAARNPNRPNLPPNP